MGSQNRASLWPVSLDTGRNTSFVIESEIALRTPCDNPMDASTYCASIREILRAGGPPLDRICRSLPNESRLANLVNLAVARRADNSLTPSWRPIWAWLNPAVEFNPIADEAVEKRKIAEGSLRPQEFATAPIYGPFPRNENRPSLALRFR
jgi:hypothetical protein